MSQDGSQRDGKKVMREVRMVNGDASLHTEMNRGDKQEIHTQTKKAFGIFAHKKVSKNSAAKNVKKAKSVKKAEERKEKMHVLLQKAGMYSAVFMMAFFVALISASAFTPVDRSEAATTEVNLTAGGYYLRVQSADTATMDLTSTAEGALAVAKDTITVTTNSPGYRVYLSMNNASDTNLWRGGLSSSGYSISTSSATVDNPQPLTANKWGWALANPGGSASTTIQDYQFDTIYCMTSGSCSDGNSGSLNTSNKFAGMPANTSPVLVAYSTTSATGGATQDIYYGVNANTALISGEYSGEVVYTAVGEASSAAEGAMGFDVDNQQSLTGISRTITTSLYASPTLINNISASDVSVTIGGQVCANPTLVVSDGTVGTSGAVNVTCTTPTMTKWGSYDVAVTIGDYESFNLRAGYSYYIPYNTIKNAAAGTYTMQQFTTKACGEMPRPATNAGKGYASNGKVIGDYADKSVPSWYDKNGNATTTNPVPQIILKDSRDNRTYQVRRLADGNCWMAQNLELTFFNSSNTYAGNNTDYAAKIGLVSGSAGGTTLTSDDTDLHSVSSIGINQFYATQSVASGTSTAWNDNGSDGVRSFSHAAYNPNTSGCNTAGCQQYAVENGVNSYGQKTFTTAATKGTGDGEETRGGNLYNWTAATLGSGLNVTGDNIDVEDSICPANWQLPTNSTDKTNGLGFNYSIRNLLQTYYNGTYTTGNPQDTTDSAKSIRLVTEQNILRSEPISMVVSGVYNRSNGTLHGRTTDGGYVWSATSGSSTYAHYLNTSPSNFRPQNSNYRGHGLTVRCVSR